MLPFITISVWAKEQHIIFRKSLSSMFRVLAARKELDSEFCSCHRGRTCFLLKMRQLHNCLLSRWQEAFFYNRFSTSERSMRLRQVPKSLSGRRLLGATLADDWVLGNEVKGLVDYQLGRNRWGSGMSKWTPPMNVLWALPPLPWQRDPRCWGLQLPSYQESIMTLDFLKWGVAGTKGEAK